MQKHCIKQKMSRYKLSQKADQDLFNIAQYGLEHYGLSKADQYRDQLKQRFEKIADAPLMYPSINHIRDGYRRSVCGVHAIYYRITDNVVEIMRILRSQDPYNAIW